MSYLDLQTVIADFDIGFSLLTHYSSTQYIQPNVDKTKELVIGTSNTPHIGLSPTSIHGKTVEKVENLGLIVNHKLLPYMLIALTSIYDVPVM